MSDQPREPTCDECSDYAVVYRTEHQIGHAIWYPQMGGYVGKAVAVMDRRWEDGLGGCVDVYVWHDGEFPFSDSDTKPICIHHCDPAQFIRFGEALVELNNRGKKP